MLRILAWVAAGLVALIAIVVAVGFVLRAELMSLFLDPGKPFEAFTPPPAPDYADPAAWAALPGREDTADLVPGGVIPRIPDGEARADIFFIHPTTYYSAEGWNAPIDDPDARGMVDEAVMPNQASVFNAAGRVFAPYYRQATLYAFMEQLEDVEDPQGPKALALAYSDVARAFETYIRLYNDGRPFILAAHSQGSLHLLRLLQDYFHAPDMRERLIAAYAVGTAVPHPDGFTALAHVPACRSAEETGCLVAWNSFTPEGDPSLWFRREVWDGARMARAPTPPLLCINPMTWRADGSMAGVTAHRGALAFTLLDESTTAVPAAERLELGARCDADGILRLSEAPPSGYAEFEIGPGDLHLYDYNLFYGNIRENADRRTAAYLATR